jgi:hypothetical protein
MSALSFYSTVQRVVDRIQRSYLDTSAPAQSYEEARAELGGGAWREAPKSTDAWFVIDSQSDPLHESENAGRQERRVRRARAKPVFVALASSTLIITCVALTGRLSHAPAVASVIAAAPSSSASTAPVPSTILGVDAVAASLVDDGPRAPVRAPTQKRASKRINKRH